MPTPEYLLDLMKDMMSGKGLKITTTVEENGQTRQVEQVFSGLSPEEALKKLDIIVEQQWPDENALPQRLAEFRKMKSPTKEQPKDLKTRFDQHPEEMKQRLSYSKLCYQAMRPILKRDAEKAKLWDELEKSIPEFDQNGKRRNPIQTLRIASLLMETDGTKESRNFNDKIASLLAVASGTIDWDEYEEHRRKSGIEAGMSEEAAKMAANLERKYGMDALADIYKERVNKSYAKIEQAREAGGMLVSGKETDVQKLTNAYELLHEEGFELMFLGTSAYGVFMRSANNYAQRQEAIDQEAKDIESRSTELKPIRGLAEEIISPYYSYLDAAELYDIHLMSIINDPVLNSYTMETTTEVFQGAQENARPTLEKYGFPDHLEDTATSRMLVYKKSVEGGPAEYLLIGVDDLGLEKGFRMKLNEHVPGRYVDDGLDQDMKGLLEQYQAAAGKNPSDAFTAVGAALNGLNGDRLGEKAEVEDRDRIGKKLRGLQKAAADYLAAGDDFVIVGDEACSALAKAVKEFADKKLEQLDLVERHMRTMQQQAAKEEWEKDTYQRGAQTVFAGELDAAMAAERGEAKDEQYQEFWAEGNIDSYIHVKENECTLPGSTAARKLYIGAKLDKYTSPEDTAAAAARKSIGKLEAKNDSLNKDIVAANVVRELLNFEEKLFPDPKNRSMLRQLASSRKVDTLVHMVRESESFFENVRSLDLSAPDARDKLLQDGVHKQVAKDIMKTVLKQQRAANSQRDQVPQQQANVVKKQAGKGLPGLH